MGTRELPRHLRVDNAAIVARAQLRLFGAVGRVHASYDQWEDYRAGMFDARIEDTAVASCRAMLRDTQRCEQAMRRVIAEWPVAAAVNLSNSGANRRAWLGQAACCLESGATASATKRAWWQLTDDARTRANRCADEVIALWELTRSA
jgi:hypothetical protein